MRAAALLCLLAGTAHAADGRALMMRFECNRCHDGLRPAPLERHCVHCHQAIVDQRYPAPAADLERWQAHLTSLRRVPSLDGLARRLRRDWVRSYLLAPRDLRPGLAATMPRLALTPSDADAIARALVPSEAPDVEILGDVERGHRLYAELRCASCHRFSGAGVGEPELTPPVTDGIALAPDLAFMRERFQRGALVGYLLTPDRETAMPDFRLSPDEAAALAAFVWNSARSVPVRAMPARLPPLARRVAFAEVYERVFRRSCRHCHSLPELNFGDGGPGNSGGFGFAARRLDLSSAIGVASGVLDRDGIRRSVFAPAADGTPRLIAVLRARQAEEAGAQPTLRGMPLGLPALSAEEVQLVETWIAQGRPN